MAKKSCAVWLSWVTLVVGILYLLGSWFPAAFGWWSNNFSFNGVFFTLLGLWAMTKK